MADMVIAKVHVSGVTAVASGLKKIPKGIIGATIEVTFCNDWADLSKTAVFEGVVTKDVIITEESVRIPVECVDEAGAQLRVGFYGVKDGELAVPTIWLDLGQVQEAADPSGDTTSDPTLPLWAQIQNMVERMKRNKKLIFTGAVSAEYDGEKEVVVKIPSVKDDDPGGNYATERYVDNVLEHLNKEVERVLNGVRRKLGALSGYMEVKTNEIHKELNKEKVTVLKAETNEAVLEKVFFSCSSGGALRNLTMNVNPSSANAYEVTQFNDLAVYDLFSLSTTNKEISGIWIDGEKKENFGDLEADGFTFHDLVVMYTATKENDYSIAVCVRIAADGVTIYESLQGEPATTTNPLVKTCLRGSSKGSVVPLFNQNDKLLIFRMRSDKAAEAKRFYIQKVEDLGNAVVKTISFNGGM